ncbi:interleukin-10 receptor subunit alpha [Pimephales promelas]|uniref:interleukin-10 receptor subunit alpha n=1 Tax=Pimephales promelas TaxID=90988 RepID=UPI00195589D8|nr:interleukin-10 receptor subunit alpha [Pimephales promelas]KAG1951293.1 interleukin-10 receptor subunit alpha [Pimephales promelas]
MDWISWISVLVTLMHVPAYTTSEELDFDIWEGNVTALWDPPEGSPIDALYQVAQTQYSGNNWEIVPECNMTTETKCELGNFLYKPETKIKVELQGNGNFSWSAIKRIRLYRSKLLAPEFNLSSTTNMVKVKIHRKPFLKELFENGPSYSAILYPKGQESQAITVSDDDEDGEVEFTSLPLWQEYCVHVKVEMISNDVSNTSLPRCIYPSADTSMVIYVAVIGVVGVMTFFMFVVCFFLRRPGKMPAVLKSAVNGWHPMHVGLIQVETVTDKGWVVNTVAEKSKAFYEDEELSEDDKERRESTDSGVSVGQQNSLKNRGTDGQAGDEDSGCGSLTGTEDSGLSGGRRSLDELPFLDGGVNSSNGKRKDDSGLGMVNKDDSDNLQGADGDLSEVVVGGDGYRSQSPSADAESKATVPYDVDTKMASPSSGYRSGHVTCSCSDFETCIWCKTRKLLTDSGSFSHEKLSPTDNHNDRPSYLRKSSVQTVNGLGLGDLSFQSDENSSESSLFITCPLLLQEPCQLDTLPLTLGDVELTFT